DAGRRWVVSHPECAHQDRVREPEVPRFPDDRHSERRQVQRIHGRGCSGLLTRLCGAAVRKAAASRTVTRGCTRKTHMIDNAAVLSPTPALVDAPLLAII